MAPLGNFLKATGTLSSLTNKPFHEPDYSWNFKDLQSGTWATSGKSKNVAKGVVAAYVFELVEKGWQYRLKNDRIVVNFDRKRSR